jgi:drug/metabolite transporter (DMT)-like permease
MSHRDSAQAAIVESLVDSHKHLHFKTFVMILIMIIAGPLGNVLLGKGMQGVGTTDITSFSDLLHIVGRVFTSGAVWLGIGSLLAFFVANILVLSWADYSFVQPASSMAYGVVALLSVFVLGESVSPLRWAGIVIICAGVFIVGRTHPRTTEHR